MQDDTVRALEALDSPQANAASAAAWPDEFPDQRTARIAQARADIERDGAQRAATADAAVTSTRALLLLFDVVVGITIGTLAHRQQSWAYGEGAVESGTPCRTFRCVGGWIAHVAHPGSRLVWAEQWTYPTDSGAIEKFSAYTQELPDGQVRDIDDLAVAALTDSEYRWGSLGWADARIGRIFHHGNTLADVWAAVDAATGGVIPAALRDDLTRDTR
jgi:hypothetical protein